MPKINLRYRSKYAYDLSINPLSKGEIWDDDVIKQSIEIIIATYFGERLFNPYFGSPLGNMLFETMNESKGEALLTDLINAIKKWEDRITILDSKCRIILNYDDNSIGLQIYYTINKNNIRSVFEKKIIF
jgi:phage baseplate assembly protein W